MAYPNQQLEKINTAFWIFALCIALFPIGLGGNRPLPLGIAQACLSVTFIILSFQNDFVASIKFPKRINWAIGLLGVVCTWAFFQTLPIIPASWANPFWHETAIVLKKPVEASIAINREAAIYGLTKLISAICVGILAFVLGKDPKQAKRLLQILWVSGLCICIYGLIQQIFETQQILWFEKWAYQGDLTATFVNRNHFAIYAGMTMVCGMGLMLQSWREKTYSVSKTARMDAVKNWLVSDGLLYVFSLLLILTCIFFSHSRSGLVLAVIGIFSVCFFFQIYGKNYKNAVMIAASAVVALIIIALFAAEFSDRFATLFADYSGRDRFKVYGYVLSAIRDNPILGYGLNNFEAVFQQYQRGMIMEFNRAHSDILESLLDLGLPFGLMLWSAIGLLISGLVHGILNRKKHGIFPVLALSATFILLCHAGIDFSMQISGVVFYWASILGVGLAQSWSSRAE